MVYDNLKLCNESLKQNPNQNVETTCNSKLKFT